MPGIIDRFFRFLVNSSSATSNNPESKAIWVYLKCSKCGEPIALRIRKTDEIQRDYDGNDSNYFVQKLVVGNKCYNRIPLRLDLDSSYKIKNKTIQGGIFITKDEYDSLKAEFNNRDQA
jgi:hypothetical protein